MKRLSIYLLSIGILIVALSGNVYATPPWLDPSLGPYMTDEESTTAKENQTFGWDETPFVFLQFDVDDLNTNNSLSLCHIWEHESKNPWTWEWETITDFPKTNSLNFWGSIDNWDQYKKVGEWTVFVAWNNPAALKCDSGGGFGFQKINFTITPEPLSAMLFVIGGAVLLHNRRRVLKKYNLCKSPV